MKFDYNNMQNMDINKMIKYLIFISFVIQWSLLSMIINLFTMGIVSIPLFILMIIDALTMIKYSSKTIKRPSYILSKIWDLIDIIKSKSSGQKYTNQNVYSSADRSENTIINYFTNICDKIKNLFNNFKSSKLNNEKYEKQRQINKFSTEIGKKITIEYTSDNNKIKKKNFEYKDQAITFINILESKGYKDYSKYNLNPKESKTYMIFNKNKDIINLKNNKIQLKKDEPDYKYVINGWPKKTIFK